MTDAKTDYQRSPDTVTEQSTTLWSVYNPPTEGYLFTSEDRDAAEWALAQNLRGYPALILVSRERHSRCEMWWGEQVAVTLTATLVVSEGGQP